MAKKMTLEQSLARLDEIAAALEDEQLPLEQSLALYEEGTRLIRQCSRQLEDAKLRVETLEKEEQDDGV